MDNPTRGKPALYQGGNGTYTGSGPGLDWEDVFYYGGKIVDYLQDDPEGVVGPIDSMTQPVEGPMGGPPAVASANGDCCPTMLPVQVVPRVARPPKGYVTVQPRMSNGQRGAKVYMRKAMARSCGLWKPRAKPPIKAGDWRCLKRASSVVKTLDRVVAMSNKVTGKARLTRSRSR
jgi:hypothetical protein